MSELLDRGTETAQLGQITDAGQLIEIFKNHAGIVIGDAVVADQHRNLPERILLPHSVIDVGGISGFDLDVLVES